MANYQDKLRQVSILLLGLLNIGFGLHAMQTPMLLGGVIGLGYVASVAAKGRDGTPEAA